MSQSKKLVLLIAVCLVSLLPASTQQKPDALKLYRAKRYQEAITVCEQELAANPNNIDSYSVLCWALVATKQYTKAEEKAIAARKINSSDIRLLEILGEAQYFLGKNNEALNMFQRYIATAPESAIDRAEYMDLYARGYWPYDSIVMPMGLEGVVVGYIWVNQECVDCRRQGGTTQKPANWGKD